MNLVVDDKEAVVVAVGELDELDFGILFVVLLQIGEELLAVAGVDGGRNAFGARLTPILSELEVANCDHQFSNSISFS